MYKPNYVIPDYRFVLVPDDSKIAPLYNTEGHRPTMRDKQEDSLVRIHTDSCKYGSEV